MMVITADIDEITGNSHNASIDNAIHKGLSTMSEGDLLELTLNKDRSDTKVSTYLIGRSLAYHPSTHLTPSMKKRLLEIAELGGPGLDRPLATTEVDIFGKLHRLDLHNNFLLHSHREVLETIICMSDHIQLSESSYEQGRELRWVDVLNLISNKAEAVTGKNIQGKTYTTPDHMLTTGNIIDRHNAVLSISLYDLSLALNQRPIRENYNRNLQKIFELSNNLLILHDISGKADGIIGQEIRQFEDLKLVYNPETIKNPLITDKSTNHVFIVLRAEMLDLLQSQGYITRSMQSRMKNYSKPTVKAFIKFVLANKGSFIHGKELDFFIKKYRESLIFPISNKVKLTLRVSILDSKDQLKEDFGLELSKYQLQKDIVSNTHKVDCPYRFRVVKGGLI